MNTVQLGRKTYPHHQQEPVDNDNDQRHRKRKPSPPKKGGYEIFDDNESMPMIKMDFTPKFESKKLLITPDKLSGELVMAQKRQMQKTRQRLAEQQRLRELHDSDMSWIYFSVLAGLAFGIANYILGIKLAQTGIYAAAFTGPCPFVILFVFRLSELFFNAWKHGDPIHLDSSNWFIKGRFHKKKFNYRNLVPLLGNFIPTLGSFLATALSFTYATKGGLNQGVLATLTALAGIFTAIFFYFYFHEAISFIQFVGMFIMIISVVLLALEGVAKSNEAVQLGEMAGVDYSGGALVGGEESNSKLQYNFIAIGFGCLAPIMITIKSFFIRISVGHYKTWDLGLDSLIFENGCYVLLYWYYYSIYGFQLEEFVWGCVVGILYFFSKQSLAAAYAKGPGGPINSIIMTQALYQTLLDVFIDGQSLGSFGLTGFILGLVGTVVLSLGNMVIKKCVNKEKYVNSPLKRFL